jgi:hypothetical protein
VLSPDATEDARGLFLKADVKKASDSGSPSEIKVTLVNTRERSSVVYYLGGNRDKKDEAVNANVKPLMFFDVKNEAMKTVRTSADIIGIDQNGYVGRNRMQLNRRYTAFARVDSVPEVAESFRIDMLLRGLPKGKYTVTFGLKVLLDGPKGDSCSVKSLPSVLLKN